MLLPLFVFVSGCQKIFDYINLPGNGGAVSYICKIKKMNSGQASYVFNYNKNGDLESVITDKLGTGNPNVFFTYDKYHRASQLLFSFTTSANSSGTYWTWEKLTYNAAGLVIKDTAWAAGEIGSDGIPLPSFIFVTITVFQYDANNRIVASLDSSWFKGAFSNTDYFAYKYDDKGNLAYTARQYRSAQTSPNQAVYNDTFRIGPYDNKIHIRRTSKTWMFIDRNYSVNNPFNATSYNAYGLPLAFDASRYLQGLVTMVPFINGTTTVDYICN